MAALDILYYGYLRDAIGRDLETVDVPSHVLTVDDLVAWLGGRSQPYAATFRPGSVVAAAIAGEKAATSDSLFGASEVALFPPVGVL